MERQTKKNVVKNDDVDEQLEERLNRPTTTIVDVDIETLRLENMVTEDALRRDDADLTPREGGVIVEPRSRIRYSQFREELL